MALQNFAGVGYCDMVVTLLLYPPSDTILFFLQEVRDPHSIRLVELCLHQAVSQVSWARVTDDKIVKARAVFQGFIVE